MATDAIEEIEEKDATFYGWRGFSKTISHSENCWIEGLALNLLLAKIIDALLPSLEPMTRRVAMMMALRGLTTSSVMAEPDEW